MTLLSRRSPAAVAGLLLLALVPCVATAQEQPPRYFPTPSVGVRAGYAFTQESPIVGLSSTVPLDRRIEFLLGGDLVLDGVDERWRIGADVVVRLGRVGEYYGGAGITMSDFDQEGVQRRRTEIGYAFVAGYEYGRARPWTLRPFIEPRWTIVDSRTFFILGVGVNYALEMPF
jgi:hypothetical protein